MKPHITIWQAREAILAELKAAGMEDVRSDDLAIVPAGSSWCAALRSTGPRLDETMAVAVAEVGRRLSEGYRLAAGQTAGS